MTVAKLAYNFKNIDEMEETLSNDDKRLDYLEELVWDGIVVSPFDETSKVYKCKGKHLYKCKNTGKYFTVKTKHPLFGNSKLSLKTWFKAIFNVVVSKFGISSVELAERLCISQPAAWRLLTKIRKYLGKLENYQQLEGTIEADEFVAGGLLKNMHYDKKLEAKAKGGYRNKIPVHGMIERNGNVVALVLKDTEMHTLQANIMRYVKQGSNLYTDENLAYNRLSMFYTHLNVVHSKGNYVSKENPKVYTNTIESFWNRVSRTLHTYFKVSEKHLQSYINECVFRHNTHHMEPLDRMIWILQNAFVV